MQPPEEPPNRSPERWSRDDVLSLAPDGRALESADDLAVGSLWRGLGCDADAVWGLYHGAVAEPYQVVVTLATPNFRCTCQSRQRPCKHALALLLLWADGTVLIAAPPAFAHEVVAREAALAKGRALREADADAARDRSAAAPPRARRPRTGEGGADDGLAVPPPPPDKRAQERAARVSAGLREFEQWMVDAVRAGLTAPALAQYATWDAAAARLVDAQAPSLANRVRRLAGAVGTRPAWHEHVLAELGTVHLLCKAGQQLWELDRTNPALAESVRTALGRTIRQADVLAGPAEPDLWMVCGRSEAQEDRFMVRREWLRSVRSQEWALLLSFAAPGQPFGVPLRVGAVVAADMHRYPGLHELRCVPVGLVDLDADLDVGEDGTAGAAGTHEALPGAVSIAAACAEVGTAIGAVPWLERWPVNVHAAPGVLDGRWVLSDSTGSLPLVSAADLGVVASFASPLATLVALSGGRAVDVTCEWTPSGLLPVAVHLAHRSVDIAASPAAMRAQGGRGVA